MKRIVLLFLSLFSLLSMLTNEQIGFDGQIAIAQRMYAEIEEVVIIGSASGGGSYNSGFGDPGDNFGDGDDLFGNGSDNSDNSEGSNGDNNYEEPDYGSEEPGPSTPTTNTDSKVYCKGIREEDVVRGINKSPSKINQNGSTCSAAVIQKLLAETDSKRYREIVWSLYRTGKYKSLGLELSSCYKSLKTSDVEKLHDPVDLMMQCAIINKMNLMFDYDPRLDNGDNWLGNAAGMQWPGRVEDFLSDLCNYSTISLDNPSCELLEQLDYSGFFVIAFVDCSSDPNNLNFEGKMLHFAQITNVTDSDILYWSWGKNNRANKNSIKGIHKIILVYK